MKKLLLSMMVLVLLAAGLVVVGCAAEEAQDDTLKIGLILPSGRDDMSWSQGMYEGVNAVIANMGAGNARMAVTENVPNPVDAGAAIRDYANQGFNIIIAHGSQYQNPLMEVAADFPEVTFAHGTAFETAQNIFAYDPQAQLGAYLFGWLAAQMTESQVLGIVGPVRAGDAIKYNYGFIQGVEAADPSIRVLESYTGSFGDNIQAKEMAEAHINARADILTGTAQQVVGAIQAVSENDGVYWFANDTDQSPLAPNSIIASQAYSWETVVQYMVDSHMAGKLGGEIISLDLTNERIQLVFNPVLMDLVPADLMAEFEVLKADVASGAIQVRLPE
ncbi:MAG: BMP family ABC transporter substrate-binding protein [Spirochaetaceae bacterium]|nr:MAG: BMP family ABC transporter substrate-binding protein [Spirochaetaceae bacterium]